jgi:superfamily I DNA and/or RNA helicase
MLQNAVKEKLKISKEIVLMRSRERTYADVTYNRLNNMITYRDLIHQVTKKRKIWPIRRLISHFSRELFNLIPCWLTSPESASAIFPMEKLFDLVIFDEASQCFSERGLPAMYRGRQLVIAGDSKQLSPFDLYKTRWDDDEEDHPDLEVDSLLDLTDKYLMQVHLKGHYRSQSLDLIDFSNKHFYEGNLVMLPDRKILNRNKPAIEFIKLEGIWEDNFNLIEAHYVADLVYKVSEEYPGKDIGVVTFNARQQDLIQDLIEEKSVQKGIFMPDNLFIKNIENVQGDERDIIIFSLTHGPDKKGKLNMQFGSLNIINGENRLNVAITRAKEKIYVVTSFYPQEMATEHLKNEGPKLLRKYLEYAYNVSSKKYKPEIRPAINANANWYLKNKLSQALKNDPNFKLNISDELPFSDLTLFDGKAYYGLILTDDDLYYQSVSAKETHVYNPFTLSSKNWKFKGVFSRELWQDKGEVVERLVRFSNYLAE